MTISSSLSAGTTVKRRSGEEEEEAEGEEEEDKFTEAGADHESQMSKNPLPLTLTNTDAFPSSCRLLPWFSPLNLIASRLFVSGFKARLSSASMSTWNGGSPLISFDSIESQSTFRRFQLQNGFERIGNES